MHNPAFVARHESRATVDPVGGGLLGMGGSATVRNGRSR